MKLSVKAHYGIQALLELAQEYGGGERRIGAIAKAQKIPPRFLEQILLVLKRAGLVASSRGRLGGYSLAKSADKITLLSIIEALDGPIELAHKKIKKSSILFEALERVQTGVKSNLAGVTLEELVIKKRQKDRAYIYNI